MRISSNRFQTVVVIGIIGLLSSLILYSTLRRNEHRQIRKEFKHRSADRMRSIEKEFASGMAILSSISAHVEASSGITQQDFRSFTKPLFSETSPFQAIGWNSRVRFEDLRTHLQAAKLWEPDYKLTEMSQDGTVAEIDLDQDRTDARELVVVDFIEPHFPNRSAVGFNIASEPIRREAVKRARDTGKLAVSGPIKLVQETGNDFGMLAMAPVYEKGFKNDSIEQRRIHFKGMIVGVYRIGISVGAALSNANDLDVDVYLFDETASPEARLLYVHSSTTPVQSQPVVENLELLRQRDFIEALPIEMAGRRWVLLCAPTTDYIAQHRTWLPPIVAAWGVVGTLALVLYLIRLAQFTNRLQHHIAVREEQQESIREHERMLAHVSRLNTMGEMVAGIAHEVNQPLTSIANLSAACSKGISESDCEFELPLEEWSTQIGEQAIRCGEIIKRLRGFVKRSELEWKTMDLTKVITDSISLFSHDARARSVRIIFDPTQPGPFIRGNHIELQQVIVNLLRNAYEAVSGDDCLDRRVLVHVSQSDDSVHLVVEDFGSSIEPEHLGKIFDAFFTTKRDGMGMGLAISRSIIEAHGGRIWLDPEDRPGTKFHVTLPVVERTRASSSKT